MSSGRTPRTSTVRYCWQRGHTFPLSTEPEERYAEFDRWLAAHDAEVRNATLEEAALISLEMEANEGEGYYGQGEYLDVAAALRAKKKETE